MLFTIQFRSGLTPLPLRLAHFFNHRERSLCASSARAYGETMVIFKCPFCRAEYEMTTAHLAFQQRSYAKCQVCYRTMYSWASRTVPLFVLVDASEDKTLGVKR